MQIKIWKQKESKLSTTQPPPTTALLYFIAFLVIILLVRLRRILYGSKVSVTRTILFSAYYVFMAVFVTLGSFYVGMPIEYYALFVASALAALFLSYRVASAKLTFWKTEDGSVYSKGGTMIYAVYVLGIVARVAIGYLFVGPNYFSFSLGQPTSLSQTAMFATVVTDLLLAFGLGLLIGRNMQILRKYRAYKAGREAVPISS